MNVLIVFIVDVDDICGVCVIIVFDSEISGIIISFKIESFIVLVVMEEEVEVKLSV